ncbi:MAG TPA: UbiD family decarboxylase, partial [Pirellulales bacterium]|nr:UbiD family decarboxylase [Pirellulales bacterium]
AGGPALYFARVKGCRFPLAANLFGTLERARFLFRDTLAAVQQLIALKLDPLAALKQPGSWLPAAKAALHMRPRRVHRAPVFDHEIRLADLPQIWSWPRDGGPFITLPQVYTEDPRQSGWRHSNLGMYRVQLAGNRYRSDAEAGLHYQIHRGIGVHHAAAIERGEPLRVCVFVGGTPAMTLAAVMPLPEAMSELAFAGALAGHSIPLASRPGLPSVYAEADFCLVGRVAAGRQLPEGPFGDHLGYYSLVHDFPVLEVEHVFHRSGAIWPFTTVGRPPQEDTTFGALIHELTGPVVPTLVPGLRAVHAVDAAGVHPLLLAIGSERYVPYAAGRQPRELLTQANALLGQGQLSLAKYLLIVAGDDAPALDIQDIASFFRHLLARVDWHRDLHFQTCTTIDTLDYSGTALNEGSKLVIAAAGEARRELPLELPSGMSLPPGLDEPRVGPLGGVLVVRGRAFAADAAGNDAWLQGALTNLQGNSAVGAFSLVVVVDDSELAARNLGNWLWVTFTRSNPAADVHGVEPFIEHKHWGCRGPLVIDARAKPHHAPPLESDPEVVRRVEALAARGGPLHGVF